MSRTRVLVVRGHQATPWELAQWEALPSDRFEVAFLKTRSNRYDTESLALEERRVRSLRDFLPRGGVWDTASTIAGDRYFGIDSHLAWAEIVHAEELCYWFAAEVAKRKPKFDYKLAMTVWETIPMLEAYRNSRGRAYRQQILAATDLFLPSTDRARNALLLEGVESERLTVCHPGIDTDRFGVAAQEEPVATDAHVILSPGRLVWEKGHQDVIRALAALKKGLVPLPESVSDLRLLIVGSGPEEERLMRHAAELGVADAVEIRGNVPYEEMPAVYAGASCMVLASLPAAFAMPPVMKVPRFFWEEQFGLVLVEAMAAGLQVIASDSGAIPEVVGERATLFHGGDWHELARQLANGPLSRRPAERVNYDAAEVEHYSTAAVGERYASIYSALVGS